MKLFLICLLACLAVPALSFPRHPYRHHKQPEQITGKIRYEGNVYFEGCYEDVCHKDRYHGYDCHEGYCGRVCDMKTCWEPDYKTIKGKAKIEADVVFEGCYEDVCHKDRYHGYDCHEGLCSRVCDVKTCWEPEYKTFKAKAQIEADIVFDGCYEEECHQDRYHGYNCHEGFCDSVCDLKTCWEPEYKTFKGKAKIEADVVFDGCHKEECHRDRYHGYNCHEGYCGRVCDVKNCWEPEYKTFKGKAKIEADVVFDGCYEEECHRDRYHGYNCHEGYCSRVCDVKTCWEPEYKTFKGKAKIEADVVFDGCYEEECHQDRYHGYNCHEGYCGHVCDLKTCWKPEYKKFSGKAKIHGEVVFDGCYEERCHNDEYYGYACKRGICEYVCDTHKCYSS